jgi:5-methylcytosine-specific restriction endonuclease McrA
MSWPSTWTDNDPAAILEARYTATGVAWNTSLGWSDEPPTHDKRIRPATENLAALQAMPYPEYLQSEHWRQTRRRALERAAFHCRICGNGSRRNQPLNVHHLTYERLGQEADSDLIALCRTCHQTTHGITPE